MYVVQDLPTFFESIQGLTCLGHDHGAFEARVASLEVRTLSVKGQCRHGNASRLIVRRAFFPLFRGQAVVDPIPDEVNRGIVFLRGDMDPRFQMHRQVRIHVYLLRLDVVVSG